MSDTTSLDFFEATLARPVVEPNVAKVVHITAKDAHVSEDWYFLDLIICGTALLVISPLLLIIAAVVGMTGSIFYRQVRVGKNGKTFEIIKFRTMIEGAESKSGPVLAVNGDSRITKVGAFLRATHLDELPQLINVVKGDMALIGPRPERPVFTQVFDKTIPGYSSRHNIRPGITGLAQIKLAYDATAAEKIQYDLFYLNNRESFILNLKIAIGTGLKMMGMPTAVRAQYSKLIQVSFS